MSSRVRLLPTLIGAAGVLLFLRIGAMAASPEGEQPAEPAPAAEASESKGAEPAPSAPKEGEATAAKEPGASADPSAAQAAQAAPASEPALMAEAAVPQTKGEADVLQRLGERREALESREKELVLREQMLAAAEKQIDSRLGELKQLEQKLEVLMGKRNEQEEAQLVGLVKSYESMKPDDAARIFNRLERGILVDVASRMKPVKIGAVMAAMEPARAQDLTVLLAKRLKLSQVAPPAAPAVAPLAEAPAEAMPAGSVDATPPEPAPEASAPPNG
jgi:flagellar motility protein MotE (MotC chaperone)